MTTEEPWACPVCYKAKDEVDGVVQPGCAHEICLPCYSEIRDRTDDPVCVLCRRIYYRRSAAAADGIAGTDIWPAADIWPIRPGRTYDAERPPMRMLQGGALRPIVPAATNDTVRTRRAAERASVKRPLGSMKYKDLAKLLVGPAVDSDGLPVPPAAINTSCTMRVLQARILGLKAATEAQRAAAAERREKRAATKGVVGGAERAAAVKTFSGAVAPVRGFRFGDIHIRPLDGVVGKCIGHHLWSYEDGSRWRKGVRLAQ